MQIAKRILFSWLVAKHYARKTAHTENLPCTILRLGIHISCVYNIIRDFNTLWFGCTTLRGEYCIHKIFQLVALTYSSRCHLKTQLKQAYSLGICITQGARNKNPDLRSHINNNNFKLTRRKCDRACMQWLLLLL